MGSTTFELTCIFHFGNILVIVMFIFANYVKGKKTYESFDSLNKQHINFFFFFYIIPLRPDDDDDDDVYSVLWPKCF